MSQVRIERRKKCSKYLEDIESVQVHVQCRKNYTRKSTVAAVKRIREEEEAILSRISPPRRRGSVRKAEKMSDKGKKLNFTEGMKYRRKEQKETRKRETTKRRKAHEEEDMEEMPSPKRPRDDLSSSNSEGSQSPSKTYGSPAREDHSSEDLSSGGRSGQDRSLVLNRPIMTFKRRTVNERERFGRQKIPANAHAYVPTNAPGSGFLGRGQGGSGANIPGGGQRPMPKKDIQYCEATSTVENNAAMEMDDE